MGVDCQIELPGNVRIKDVADIIGRVLGRPAAKETLSHNAWCTRVDGVHVDGIQSLPECANITINDTKVGMPLLRWLYHFEPSGFDGRLLNPRSTARNIAIGLRLIRFFGGRVVADDCVARPKTWRVKPKRRHQNSPDDGRPWNRLQQRTFDEQPLTEDELVYADKYAAYKRRDLDQY